jgi:hypothetical protein
MGKSSPTKQSLIGSSDKHESYRKAWERIFLAIEHSFFLEAIALEESIITDRLASFFAFVGVNVRGKQPSFKQLIDTWKHHFPSPIGLKREPNLQASIDDWRRERNSAVHGFVKDMSVEEFLQHAEKAARQGAKLARYTCEWCAKQLRPYRSQCRKMPPLGESSPGTDS